MGDRIAAFDWSRSPLGPISGWSAGLRSAVRMLLASKAQIVAFWGPDHVALYNDGSTWATISWAAVALPSDGLLSASQEFGSGEAIDDTALLVLRVTAA
jgi:hypothetical protein